LETRSPTAHSGNETRPTLLRACKNKLPMNDLLELAVEAHGGLKRWSQLTTVKASLSITGKLWQLKAQPEALKDVVVEAQLKRQQLTTHLIAKNRRSVFTPDRVSIESESGILEEGRDDPRSTFQGQRLETPWDDLHVAYFNSYALWNYLTIPFLYTYPGFVIEKLATWKEDGEHWRALKVRFPDYIATHTRNQISYFGPEGLLRRHEYTVDLLGNAPGLNYASDYRNVAGVAVPTKRRVFAYDSEKRKIPGDPLVAIDIREIAFS
jgi:hypothetical protein